MTCKVSGYLSPDSSSSHSLPFQFPSRIHKQYTMIYTPSPHRKYRSRTNVTYLKVRQMSKLMTFSQKHEARNEKCIRRAANRRKTATRVKTRPAVQGYLFSRRLRWKRGGVTPNPLYHPVVCLKLLAETRDTRRRISRAWGESLSIHTYRNASRQRDGTGIGFRLR